MGSSVNSKISPTALLAVFAATVLVSSFVLIAPLQAADAQTTKKLKIALVTDALFSDGGWGATAYTAAKRLETKYGHQLAYA